jgi:hypothetical protein
MAGGVIKYRSSKLPQRVLVAARPADQRRSARRPLLPTRYVFWTAGDVEVEHM